MISIRTYDRTETNQELVWSLGGAGLLAAWFLRPLWQPLPISFCLLKRCTGIPCVLCGGTRCLIAMTHGHVIEALAWNPLAALGAAALGLYWIYCLAATLIGFNRRLRIDLKSPRSISRLRWGAFAAGAVNWVYLICVGR